ncbi:MAG: helix-turn-helix domain-containing protein [Firmicutes bacterium]|nr:helix-turn-helix domain-containing protein [Bacillota bacterium]MDY3659186.1 helix-turn-helix transcriptional regulator [Eubacteriales bacterium]
MKILLPQRLTNLRIASGLSKLQLANAISVSDTAIGKWENGLRQPSLACLWKLADFFDVTVDFLIGREEV